MNLEPFELVPDEGFDALPRYHFNLEFVSNQYLNRTKDKAKSLILAYSPEAWNVGHGPGLLNPFLPQV